MTINKLRKGSVTMQNMNFHQNNHFYVVFLAWQRGFISDGKYCIVRS